MGVYRQGVRVCVTHHSFDLVPRSLSDRMSVAMPTAAAIACAGKKNAQQSAVDGPWTGLGRGNSQHSTGTRYAGAKMSKMSNYPDLLDRQSTCWKQLGDTISSLNSQQEVKRSKRQHGTSLGHYRLPSPRGGCRATVARMHTHTSCAVYAIHAHPYNTFAPPTCSPRTVCSRRALSRERIVRCRLMLNAFHDMHAG